MRRARNSAESGREAGERNSLRRLRAHEDWITQVLKEDREAPIKQRHTAWRIFERRFDERGYTGAGACGLARSPRHRESRQEPDTGRAWHPNRRPDRAQTTVYGVDPEDRDIVAKHVGT